VYKKTNTTPAEPAPMLITQASGSEGHEEFLPNKNEHQKDEFIAQIQTGRS